MTNGKMPPVPGALITVVALGWGAAIVLGMAGASATRADESPDNSAESRSWTFGTPEAEGYTVKLQSVDPAPGTPLIAGSEVTVTVNVAYTMSVARHGVIVLVPQDDNGQMLAPDRPQVSLEVSAPGGVATLKQRLVVPKAAGELRLFVPLVPDGLTRTKSEVAIRYPIAKPP